MRNVIIRGQFQFEYIVNTYYARFKIDKAKVNGTKLYSRMYLYNINVLKIGHEIEKL